MFSSSSAPSSAPSFNSNFNILTVTAKFCNHLVLNRCLHDAMLTKLLVDVNLLGTLLPAKVLLPLPGGGAGLWAATFTGLHQLEPWRGCRALGGYLHRTSPAWALTRNQSSWCAVNDIYSQPRRLLVVWYKANWAEWAPLIARTFLKYVNLLGDRSLVG